MNLQPVTLAYRTEQSPQEKVRILMRCFGQRVRFNPEITADPVERMLRAKLVLEEALELVEALGFQLRVRPDSDIIESSGDDSSWHLDGIFDPDLVAAADAVGDLLVVTYGAANSLGIDAGPVFEEVHRSNMTKVGTNGQVTRRELDGKVVKPETYQPPDIISVLEKQGWKREP